MEHPQATTILVLGILAIVICGPLGIVAWVMGNNARRDIQMNPGRYAGEGKVTAGWVLGIVATCLLIFSVLMFLLLVGSS